MSARVWSSLPPQPPATTRAAAMIIMASGEAERVNHVRPTKFTDCGLKRRGADLKVGGADLGVAEPT